MIRALPCVVFALLAAVGWCQDALNKLERFDFAKKKLVADDLAELDEFELSLARGLVFARHGRVFKDSEIQNYIEGLSWYKPDRNFKNSVLNALERSNLDMIREAEAKKHKTVQPGDLRFWMDREITKEKLGKPNLIDLHIMKAEIEAIHGRTFPDQPQIQAYFEDRYWYRPSKKYDPSKLSPTERKNIATIAGVEAQQRKLGLQPGDMQAYQHRRISKEMLRNLSLHELRLLRNEVYALRGYRFSTRWLADHFANYEWYKPSSKKPALTKIESQNLADILARENAIHEGLSKSALTDSMLDGLWLEDVQKLRNEIYARHGRVFKQKWLQAYFESFPWYKRNPAYSDRQLSAIEKQNLAVIMEYEKTAQSQFNLAEG